jgi:hypothetical protein
MQIKKSKGVVSVKLTQYERRQLEGAQEIIDTVRALGGTAEDVEELVTGDGTITIGANSEIEDKEAVKAPQGAEPTASSKSKSVG